MKVKPRDIIQPAISRHVAAGVVPHTNTYKHKYIDFVFYPDRTHLAHRPHFARCPSSDFVHLHHRLLRRGRIDTRLRGVVDLCIEFARVGLALLQVEAAVHDGT